MRKGTSGGCHPLKAAASMLAVTCLLASCTVTERQVATQAARSDELDRKIQRLEQAVAELQRTPKTKAPEPEMGRRLDKLGKEAGDLRARLDALEEKSRRIADLEQQADQTRKEAAREAARVEDDLTKELAGVSKHVDDVAKKLKELEGRIQARTEASIASAGPGDKAPAVSERKPSAQALYDEAYGLYKDRKYETARQKFQDYIRLHPDTPLADNAQFWIGETYYYQAMAEKDPAQYEKAILEYDKVIQRYPKGNKVASALLKQALAFKAIDDPSDAKILLRKVLRDHPQSEAAKIAESELKALGE